MLALSRTFLFLSSELPFSLKILHVTPLLIYEMWMFLQFFQPQKPHQKTRHMTVREICRGIIRWLCVCFNALLASFFSVTASSSTIHPNLFTMDSECFCCCCCFCYNSINMCENELTCLSPAELHMPLYMTAVTCATAILCVCMFMLGLMLAVKHRRPGPRPNREVCPSQKPLFMYSVSLQLVGDRP